MKKLNKAKLFATLSFIPILFLLGLFLFTGENVEILKTVFSKDLTNEEIRQKYGDRIADRFNEMMNVIIFKNKSFRR